MRVFHGWYVVGAAFLVALWGFGLGLYGPGLYLATLHVTHGWPIAVLSSAVALYYLLGAVWTIFVGDVLARLGPRRVVTCGCLAMATGVAALTGAGRLWHVYAAFVLMSFGWAAMNGAAVASIIAPWFNRKRGLAISLALNGGSCGGIIVTPVLAFLIARHGFRVAVGLSLAAMLAVLIPVALTVLGRRPEDIGTGPDGDPSPVNGPPPGPAPAAWSRRAALRERTFLTISIPFVLGFLAQLGFLTHQVTYLLPIVGLEAAALAVSMTTVAAILGRTITGVVVDRLDPRRIACANFLLQAGALAILYRAESSLAVYGGCILFGLGVGNMNTLPPLLVQREFPREHFTRVVSLVVGVNQFAFAVGPVVLGALRHASGDYRSSFLLGMGLEIAAAAIVLLGRPRRQAPAA